MKLTSGDQSVVQNMRFKFPQELAQFSDEQIAQAWRDFSQSDEYPDEQKFLEWPAMYTRARRGDFLGRNLEKTPMEDELEDTKTEAETQDRISVKIFGVIIGSAGGWDQSNAEVMMFNEFTPAEGFANLVPNCDSLVINPYEGSIGAYRGEELRVIKVKDFILQLYSFMTETD